MNPAHVRLALLLAAVGFLVWEGRRRALARREGKPQLPTIPVGGTLDAEGKPEATLSARLDRLSRAIFAAAGVVCCLLVITALAPNAEAFTEGLLAVCLVCVVSSIVLSGAAGFAKGWHGDSSPDQ